MSLTEIELKGIVEVAQKNKTVRKLLYRVGDERILRELDITNYKIETEDDIYELAETIIQQYEVEQQGKGKGIGRLVGRRIGKKDVERWKAKKQQEEVEEWKTESLDFSEL